MDELGFYVPSTVFQSFRDDSLQENAGNNFSYLIPKESQYAGGGRGGNLPRGKVPPPLNPHVNFHFYVMIKGIQKSLVI